jgi:DNA-3-methyladenine glycosylase I
MKKNEDLIRCGWCGDDPLYIRYHDKEWGQEIKDDQTLFEFLVLESAQAGLSWITILRKRENYRKAFAEFDVVKVSKFTEKDVHRLMQNEGIVRNRRKIETTITNAQYFLKIRNEFGSFYSYLLSFMPERKLIKNHWKSLDEIPASTTISDAISKDMKKRGFRFFGTTICYAFMQSVGLVDDHIENCCIKKR